MGGDDQLSQHSSQSSTLPDDDSGCCDNQGGGVPAHAHTCMCSHIQGNWCEEGRKGVGEADRRAEEGGTEEAAGVITTLRHCCLRGK